VGCNSKTIVEIKNCWLTPMKIKSSPTLFLEFSRWYCNPKLRDSIEGDLLEVYGERVKQKGQRKAYLQFCIDVLLLLRPAIIKPIAGYENLNTLGMYKSYFKVGWRNLVRNKGYSFINIGGLAIGMAVAMLNGLWIWDELSYDKYFDNYSRIAYVAERGLDYERGGQWVGTTMTYPLATELKDQYAQHFKRISRASWDVDAIFSAGEQKVSANGIYVDKDFPPCFP
jgi:putative ABC transport system permease protein